MNSTDSSSFSAISQVHSSEAQSRSGGGPILLDVRTPEEYLAGHAPGVVFLPLQELEGRFHELDPVVPIVAICRAGGRSQTAAEFLTTQGYQVANLVGGMQAWASDGFDVVTDEGTPGVVI